MNVRANNLTVRQSTPLKFEALESRVVLSGTGPNVTGVNVSSSLWDADFIDYLEANSLGESGYAIPVGDSSQLDPLPWNNIDRIHITFGEDVSVDAADLSISGVDVTAYEVSGFTYDSQSYTATWTLAHEIAADRVFLDLGGDGLDPVSNITGAVLDGEWTDAQSTFDSGNGTAGGDFEFRFNVLPGDVSQSGGVSGADVTSTWFLSGRSTGDAGYDPFRDVDGSGLIDASDYGSIIGVLFTELPDGDPAGVSNDAPTTRGLAAVQVDEDAADVVLSLFDAFDDAEDIDADLTYEIVSNTNSALFESIAVDQVMGELSLDFADDAFGEADLIVRATDSSGLFVETPLHVDVAAVNDAPVISDYFGTAGPANIWTFTGVVTDVDDDPTGWIVDFFGVLDGKTATVQADGTFELVVQLSPTVWGDSWIQTEDSAGAESNQPSFFVGVT